MALQSFVAWRSVDKFGAGDRLGYPEIPNKSSRHEQAGEPATELRIEFPNHLKLFPYIGNDTPID